MRRSPSAKPWKTSSCPHDCIWVPSPQSFVTNCLIQTYIRCSDLGFAYQVFDKMPERDVVSWNALIFGYAACGEMGVAKSLFEAMPERDVVSWNSLISGYLQTGECLKDGNVGVQVHSMAMKMGFHKDVVTGSALVDMYAKCRNLDDALLLFREISQKNWVSWSAVIAGCVQNEAFVKGLELFKAMLKEGIGVSQSIYASLFRLCAGLSAFRLEIGLGFNEISLSGAFSACAVIKGHVEGLQVHGLAIKSTLTLNICVANAILDMYGKCGALAEACLVFDEMQRRDAVSWNAIIAAHEQNGKEEETLSYFVLMLHARMEPDEFTYGSVLKACAGQQALNYGMEIHNRVIKSGMGLNWFVGSTLVDMYCKCGMMEEAEKIHDRTQEQAMVSWNAIISGFSGQKQSENAQKYFSRMMEMGVKPDNFTYATVLDTCANLATVGLESRIIFEKASKRDFVTWNAMICGYAQHGYGDDALKSLQFGGGSKEGVVSN
ncbi:hypothetical protein Patl1_21576 [Pistacia atlantica]|uniref:Uncharacterized protein n=1 Tax=Pistacia atlantica TaxID=434234 RepID=A0ACC1BNA8_9ROSI|nr:hypothetical protein Patl1_21576 [Pistacia atlantica]